MPIWIEVKVFFSRIEADIAKSALKSEGIAAEIKADDQGGMRPQMALAGGVKLLVKKQDAQKAQKLLSGK